MKDQVIAIHREKYGDNPKISVFQAPGRVNLIGEHTDYNDGYVLPTPIGRHIWIAATPRKDKQVNIVASDFNEQASFKLGKIKFNKDQLWVNYVQGVAKILQEEHKLKGADMVIKGNVPIGVGLGSSAALETATVRAFTELNEIELDPVSAAYVGKRAENEFVGVQSGIMDQFVSGIGEHGKALFIDCRSNEYRKYPLGPDYVFVMVNSMVTRELASSAYNERNNQCRQAVKILNRYDHEIKALRDVSPDFLLEHWDKLPELIQRRTRHVVTENQRVLESIELLEQGEMFKFGDRMYDSHDSLAKDYDVSCEELDKLVELTKEMREVVGSRMTGAGFGGCTVNLMEKEFLEQFKEQITSKYVEATSKTPEFYVA